MQGIWLGVHEETGENLVALLKPHAPVILVRTIARRPVDERWDAESVSGVKAEPGRPHPRMSENTEVLTRGQAQTMKADKNPEDDEDGEEQEGQFDKKDMEEDDQAQHVLDPQEIWESGAAMDPAEMEDGEEVMRRNFRITKRLIEDLGASPGCQACENTRSSIGTRGLMHSPECRKTFEAKVLASEKHRRILNKRDQRHKLAPEDDDVMKRKWKKVKESSSSRSEKNSVSKERTYPLR